MRLRMSLSLLFFVLLLRLISNRLISLDRSLQRQRVFQDAAQAGGRLQVCGGRTHSKMNSSVKTGFWPSLGCVLATWTLFR